MEKTDVIIAKLRNWGELVGGTFKFLKQEFKPLMKVILTYVGPFLLITGFLAAWSQNQALESIIQLSSGNLGMMGNNELGLLPTFLYMLGALVSSIFLPLALFSYIKLYKERGRGGFRPEEVWRIMMAKFFPVFGTTLLIGLLLGVGFFIVAATAALSPVLMIFFVMGYVVFVVYIMMTISLFIPAYVFEDLSISQSIARSRFLIKDFWWFTFGLAIVTGMIASMGQHVFYLPYYILLGIVAFTSASGGDAFGGSDILSTIFMVIGTLGSYLLYSIPQVTMGLHYHSQVEKKESPGLIDKIDQINAPDDTTDDELGF